MIRPVLGAAFLWCALLPIASASAQQTPSGLPRSVASAGVTQQDWQAIRDEASRQARRAGIAEAALLAAAEATGARLAEASAGDATSLRRAILDGLSDQADRIANLYRLLDAWTGEADASTVAMLAQARGEIDAGRLAEADRLLALIAEREVAAVQLADVEAERRRLRAGETIAGRGQIAHVQADFLAAAAHFERAAETVPQAALEPRWAYRNWQAQSLYQRGVIFGEAEPLQGAVEIYQILVLPLASSFDRRDYISGAQVNLGNALQTLARYATSREAARRMVVEGVAAYRAALEAHPRETDPEKWGDLQHNLGTALIELGEGGDASAFAPALAALDAALLVRTRAESPIDWAESQNSLANLWAALAEAGDEAALDRAIAAFDSALEVFTRSDHPRLWATTQMNKGILLWGVGKEDTQLLEHAIACLRASLEVLNAERTPYLYANAMTHHGVALRLYADRTGSTAALEDALASFRAALAARTREAAPRDWAFTQASMGLALHSWGEHADPAALQEAVAAYRAALEVYTPAEAPADWAGAQYNLGRALDAIGDRGDPQAWRDAANAYRSALRIAPPVVSGADWAFTHWNLALTLRSLALAGDRQAPVEGLAEARQALSAFEAAGYSDWAREARRLVAELENR